MTSVKSSCKKEIIGSCEEEKVVAKKRKCEKARTNGSNKEVDMLTIADAPSSFLSWALRCDHNAGPI